MKSGLYLIVETPRAGNLGHRTLVSEGFEQAAAISLVDKIRASRIGPNYISASREVQQKSDSGGVRVGIETIGLVGVDVGRLSRHDRESISTQLAVCLALVEQLVLHRMDWQTVGENEVVLKCVELDDWLASRFEKSLPLWETKPEDRQNALLNHQFDPNSRPERPNGKRTIYIGILAFLVLFVILYSLWIFIIGRSTKSPVLNQAPSSEGATITTIKSIEGKILDALATSYNKNAEKNAESRDIADAVTEAYKTCPNDRGVIEEQIVKDIRENFGNSQGISDFDGRISAWMLLKEETALKLQEFIGITEHQISPADARFYQEKLKNMHNSIIALGVGLASADYKVKSRDKVENDANIESVVSGFNELLDLAKSTANEKERLPSPYFYSFDENVVRSLRGFATSIYGIDENAFVGQPEAIGSAADWPAILRSFGRVEVRDRFHKLRSECLKTETSSISDLEIFFNEWSVSIGEIVKGPRGDQ